ncbi:MAG: hypothetical protein ACOY81_08130 [Bacillota bacterium]|uniref:hypothetical protein n=1 Tax=Desulfurispora thermophila TaxID=265470 RepID=UPI0003646EA1|nr:hypothetical protein [Desulfurispora thermophila]
MKSQWKTESVPSIETTINAQTTAWLSEAELAALIRQMAYPPRFAAQLHNLFADVPLADMERFLHRHGISDAQMRCYYLKYIKEFYPRPELEEMLL